MCSVGLFVWAIWTGHISPLTIIFGRVCPAIQLLNLIKNIFFIGFLNLDSFFSYPVKLIIFFTPSLNINLVTVNVTVYFPGTLYLCVGFRAVEVLLSPKSQDQKMGDPVLLSLKFIVGGSVEKEAIISKSATRGVVVQK